MPRSVLLVELGERPSRLMRRSFLDEGFKVDSAVGIEHAQNLAAMSRYDGVIAFPGAVLRLIGCVRALRDNLQHGPTPIVALADLTAADEILALDAGASLCLPAATPFAELLARLRALLQIAEGFPQHYRISDLGIDPIRRRASRGGIPLRLRPVDFDTLLFLAERADRLVTHDELHRRLWPSHDFSKNRIAVQMHKVRRAILDGRQAPLLHTVRDCGYLLSPRRPDRHINRL